MKEPIFWVCADCYEEMKRFGDVHFCPACQIVEGPTLELTEKELSEALGES